MLCSGPLVVPNFGTMSLIRDIWPKCPYFVPNCEYFCLKIGTLAIYIHICTNQPLFVPILLIFILWYEVDCDRFGNSNTCPKLFLFNQKKSPYSVQDSLMSRIVPIFRIFELVSSLTSPNHYLFVSTVIGYVYDFIRCQIRNWHEPWRCSWCALIGSWLTSKPEFLFTYFLRFGG